MYMMCVIMLSPYQQINFHLYTDDTQLYINFKLWFVKLPIYAAYWTTNSLIEIKGK